MISKNRLILLSAVAFLTVLTILPSTLAFSGTAYVEEIQTIEGQHISGRVSDLRTKNGVEVYLKGSMLYWWAPWQYFLTARLFFEMKSSVGSGNTLEIYFRFYGYRVIDFLVVYSDGSSDLHYEYKTSGKTVIFPLDNYKVVDYLQFYSHEYWHAGRLYIDYAVVHY